MFDSIGSVWIVDPIFDFNLALSTVLLLQCEPKLIALQRVGTNCLLLLSKLGSNIWIRHVTIELLWLFSDRLKLAHLTRHDSPPSYNNLEPIRDKFDLTNSLTSSYSRRSLSCQSCFYSRYFIGLNYAHHSHPYWTEKRYHRWFSTLNRPCLRAFSL